MAWAAPPALQAPALSSSLVSLMGGRAPTHHPRVPAGGAGAGGGSGPLRPGHELLAWGAPMLPQREGPAAAPQICPRPPRGSARPAPTAVLSTALGLGDQQQPWYNFKDNLFYSFILRKSLRVINDAVAVADPIRFLRAFREATES